MSRVEIMEQVAAEGGGLKELATAFGVSKVAARKWALRHQPENYQLIVENGIRRRVINPITATEHLRRLRLVQDYKKQTAVAAELNVSPSAVCLYLKRHAPWGIEEAIEHFTEIAEMEG